MVELDVSGQVLAEPLPFAIIERLEHVPVLLENFLAQQRRRLFGRHRRKNEQGQQKKQSQRSLHWYLTLMQGI